MSRVGEASDAGESKREEERERKRERESGEAPSASERKVNKVAGREGERGREREREREGGGWMRRERSRRFARAYSAATCAWKVLRL